MEACRFQEITLNEKDPHRQRRRSTAEFHEDGAGNGQMDLKSACFVSTARLLIGFRWYSIGNDILGYPVPHSKK
jgi:hypothetical protein